MIGWGWCGLIPARAGNTLQPRHTRINTRAHPRSRGEHCPAPGRLAAVLGSSPLARGTLCRQFRVLVARGLIPARAGNTPELLDIPGTFGAHPRSRGEHEIQDYDGIPLGGSSPLARGTLTAILRACGRVGLIPARAGNTGEKLYSSGVAGAHPRSRGEHIGAVYVSVSVVGSSPLARGTRFIPDALMQSSGLIPARAGNTRLIRSRVSEMRAHPRSRGEHSSRRLVIPSSLGSSPLARGTLEAHPRASACFGLIPARAGNTHYVLYSHWWFHGLIPARAGNTTRRQNLASSYRAHPRSRGEHRLAALVGRLAAGSSPLARGTLQGAPGCGRPLGLIPARAGNTRFRGEP